MRSMEIGESVVEDVILHQVGNRLREEPLILANQCFDITESIANLILSGYLRGIVSDKNQYMLTHESDMALNDVAHYVSAFFSRKISFVELSRNLATHLYASAHHPNIAAGDLFVILFEKLKLGGKYKSAIGIYKAESKQQYISTPTDGENRQLEVSSGINPDLIDKGVLIVDGSEIIYATDRLSSRTKYWIEDFLKAKQVPNKNTKAAVVAGLIEKVRDNIENPVARQDFCREVIALCADRDEVLGDEIRTVSEKYVPPDVWSTELVRITERKGLVDTDEINVSTRGFQTKLKKMLNRINLGQDIGLILPDNLSFSDASVKDDGKAIQIKIKLEKKNG
ncbi:TPA: nucleoid-associated protein [Pseudomonas aeruginosa]